MGESQTALVLLTSNIKGDGMTLVGSGSEDLVHPTGALDSHPRVGIDIPTGRGGKARIRIGEFAHLDLLGRIEWLRKIISASDTGD